MKWTEKQVQDWVQQEMAFSDEAANLLESADIDGEALLTYKSYEQLSDYFGVQGKIKEGKLR
jgi:hypothetical protein